MGGTGWGKAVCTSQKVDPPFKNPRRDSDHFPEVLPSSLYSPAPTTPTHTSQVQ